MIHVAKDQLFDRWEKWYSCYLIDVYSILQQMAIKLPSYSDFCFCLYTNTKDIYVLNKALKPLDYIDIFQITLDSKEFEKIGSLEDIEILYNIIIKYMKDNNLYIFNTDEKYIDWIYYFSNTNNEEYDEL